MRKRIHIGLGLGVLLALAVLVGGLVRGPRVRPDAPAERPPHAAAHAPRPAPVPERLLPPEPASTDAAVEVQAVLAYLADTTRATGLDHALKDAAMDTLHRADAVASEAAEGLLALFEDRAGDPVIREYAIQHLRRVYERLADEKGDPALRERILVAFDAALQETESSMPGTALHALHRLAGTHPDEVAADYVNDRTLALLSDVAASDRARLTACALAAQQQDARALPLVRALAADSDRSSPLRIAAIAALGELGGPDALADLDALQNEPHYAPALRRAKTRIQERKSDT